VAAVSAARCKSHVDGATTHLRFLVFQLTQRELRLKKVESSERG
jgi:hypothetical protein